MMITCPRCGGQHQVDYYHGPYGFAYCGNYLLQVCNGTQRLIISDPLLYTSAPARTMLMTIRNLIHPPASWDI
jgi:hypothetical protein